MIRLFMLILLAMSFSFSAVGERVVWSSGMSLLAFLESHSIPLRLYYNLSNADKELSSEVQVGSVCYILRDDQGKILQILIPISEDVQMHIYATKEGYNLDFIPIITTKITHKVALPIQKSPYQDLLEKTNDSVLTNQVINIYKKSINLEKFVRKDDLLAVIYTRKYRLGRTFSTPEIKAAMIETNRKSNYLFGFEDTFYDLKAREIVGFLLEMPVKYHRISSPFSYGRFHPILKQTRPHYGVDLAATYGTPIYAAASGRVIYSGYRGGYGNVVEINHGDGIRTLYGHMSKRATRSGSFVKKGQLIGYVGSTGVSTGPHLHFGVYKNNRPVNPMGIVRTTKKELKGAKKQEFLKLARNYQEQLDAILSPIEQNQ